MVRWEEDEPSEIVYIAVAPDLRGRGYGKQIIHVLQEELRRRRGHSLLVGTANAALENIAFTRNVASACLKSDVTTLRIFSRRYQSTGLCSVIC